MWANFLTVKMKNIGDEKVYSELFKMLKKDKYFCSPDAEMNKPMNKNQVDFYSYDEPIDERPIRKFSKKYKDEMIEVRSIRVHNPYSKSPDEPKDISLFFYKNGVEFLELNKGYKKKIKSTYYKIEPKYYNYKKLEIVTTVKKIDDLYGCDKNTLSFFKIKKNAKKDSAVSISFADLVKFVKYCRDDEAFLMDDIKEYNRMEITKKEFLSYFSKKELTLYSKDF